MARYFMSFFILTSCRVAGQSPIYALKGQEVNLKPAITGQPKEILWKYKGNKVVEFNGHDEQVYHPYEKRITLDWISAELNIAKLRYEDTGYYELEVYMNQELKRSRFLLEVIDRVATPRISCEMEDGSSSATLVCSAEFIQPQSLMKYEWDSHGHVQPGPNFTISLGDKHDDEIYTCRVSNPLSNETATYTAKDCYPDKSSSAALIASVLTIVVIIPHVVAVVYCKLRHKACFAKRKKGDSENPSTKGSDEKTAQGDENRRLLERAPTLPSMQPLGLLHQSNRNLRPNGLDRDHKEDVNSDRKTDNDDKGDADANEPEPAGVVDKEDLEVFSEPEQPVLETTLSEPDSQHSGLDNKPLDPIDLASNDKESKKKTDDEEEP
ncbi:CD48 antigen-like isoform X2 [Micropterus dolomieu]|uniref:CD48 antigen-like isoform X2 n=1 Tax=Micropterus dolomieu TaxID=147949 RepID=UPI001E8D2E60|nr:CD48 antigen-like isoform X2 [Micropterus dolomieu]